jgi:Na+/H+ antiporter NhaC
MDSIQKTWFNSTTKTMVIDPINAAAFAADISNCKLAKLFNKNLVTAAPAAIISMILFYWPGR